jgi:hypothetical protein
MYCFQHAGVRIDSTTKISVDARLANANDVLGLIGTTRVGRYSRNDYARLQHMTNEPKQRNNLNDSRALAWENSSTAPVGGSPKMNAGYRALSSLQMANNEHIVKSLFSEPIFDLGYGPTVDTMEDVDVKDPRYNLRYNRTVDLQSYYQGVDENGNLIPTYDEMPEYLPVDTLDHNRESTPTNPKPKVNGIMTELGQRIIPTYPTPIITDTDDGTKVIKTDGDDSKDITTE